MKIWIPVIDFNYSIILVPFKFTANHKKYQESKIHNNK